MSKGRFYFNTGTGEVQEGKRPPMHLRMGPYASREEAESAYQLARDRTAALDIAAEEEREAEDIWDNASDNWPGRST